MNIRNSISRIFKICIIRATIIISIRNIMSIIKRFSFRKVSVLSRQNVQATSSDFEKYAFCRGSMPGTFFSGPPRASAGRALLSISSNSYTNGGGPGLSFET